MENTTFQKCNACGGELKLIDKIGTIETYRCEQCGSKENVHFSIAPDELYSLQKDTVEVLIDWNENNDNLKTIMKIRKLLPSLKQYSIESIKDKIQGGQSFNLGRFFPDQAEELKNRLEEIGLNIRCVKVGSSNLEF